MLLQASISLFYMLLAEKVSEENNYSLRSVEEFPSWLLLCTKYSLYYWSSLPRLFVPGIKVVHRKKLITLDVSCVFFSAPHKCGELRDKAKEKKPKKGWEKERNKSIISWSFLCFDHLFLLKNKTSGINQRSRSIWQLIRMILINNTNLRWY